MRAQREDTHTQRKAGIRDLCALMEPCLLAQRPRTWNIMLAQWGGVWQKVSVGEQSQAEEAVIAS